MQVAFASKSGNTVDSHFAAATVFSIYEIETDHIQFLKTLEFAPAAQEGSQEGSHHDESPGGDDDKIQIRINELSTCSIIYCTSIGGPAAARLVQSRIHPIKVVPGTEIGHELERLQTMLKNNPPPWLRKRRD